MLVGDGCLRVFTHKLLIAFVDDMDDVVVQEILIPGTNEQILVGCLVQTKSNRNEMGWKLEGGGGRGGGGKKLSILNQPTISMTIP